VQAACNRLFASPARQWGSRGGNLGLLIVRLSRRVAVVYGDGHFTDQQLMIFLAERRCWLACH
jgi:hypothetical protein